MASTTRRSFIAATGAASAVFMAGRPPAVLAQNAALAGNITVMAYAGAFREKFTRTIIEPFRQRFPNVEITYFDGGNSAQMVGLLRSQRNDPQIDVAIIDASVTASVNQEGLFEALTDAELPNLKDLLPEATRVTKGYGPACTFDSYCLLFDTSRVQLKSLSQWWEPVNRELLGFAAPPNIQGIALTLLVNSMMGADYKASIDPAINKLKEIAPFVKTFEPSPDGTTMLLSGAIGLSTGWNARSQIRRDEIGDKLGILIPPEGSAIIMDTVNVVKGRKNRDAALAFANYVISAEAQEAFANSTFYGATNGKAKVKSEVLQRSVGNPELLARALPIDWGFVSPLRDQWTQRWRREIIAMSRR
jgi:putative spermidine/putrescine transport system substrate-binding protein